MSFKQWMKDRKRNIKRTLSRRQRNAAPSTQEQMMTNALVFESLEPRLLLTTFNVTTTADSGAGSLREAITAANANVNPPGVIDKIAFAIPGSGVKTISLSSALPTITDPLEIDGYSQSGSVKNSADISSAFNGVLNIVLDGSNTPAGTNGLVIDAGNSEIKGLVIMKFPASGIRITSNSGTVITGNFIGTDATGTADQGNGGDGVQISDVRGVRVGGVNAEHRNIISGNASDGVEIRGLLATNNLVIGNFIGTDKTGKVILGNSSDGITLQLGARANTIGGLTTSERNIISGNGSDGIELSGPTTTSNFVVGNYIGLDRDGSEDLGNLGDGIQLIESPSNTIGGTTAAARNVISGNEDDGISINGTNATSNIIRGNFIGTSASGGLDRGNRSDGISITNAASTVIGGVTELLRNVISGNGSDGIKIRGASATGTRVEGNFLGIGADGTTAIANDDAGIRILELAASSRIGGSATGAGNRIGFSEEAGVAVEATAGNGNAILSNDIFQIQGLAIDLGTLGITANDASPDADTGPNRLQNFPVLTSAMRGGDLIITGSLDSAASTQYRIEFFTNDGGSAQINQNDAQHFIGAVTVTTNASGRADFSITLPQPAFGVGGDFLTASATHVSLNDTSELSAAIAIAVDSEAPAATLTTAPDILIPGATTYSFSIAYQDDSLVQRSLLGAGDVRVTGPNGFSQLATFVSASSTVNAAAITATYRITAPGGSWDGSDTGEYSIAIEPDQVFDLAGNAAATSTAIGTFAVEIPIVSITALDATAAETAAGSPANTATFRISRGNVGSTDVTINFTRSGTATFGPAGDYTLEAGGANLTTTSIVIPAGEEHVDVTVIPVESALVEATETIILTIATNKNYTLDPVVANRKATVNVLDNPSVVSIQALDDIATEATVPVDTGTFRISRTGSTTAALTVKFTRSGTAKLGATGDYTLSAGGVDLGAKAATVVIPAGEDHIDVTLTAVNNLLAEPSETAILTLATSTLYVLDPVVGNRSATVTVADDEPLVTIEAIDATAAETNTGDTANPGTFRISRTGDTTAALAVKFTRTGTATLSATGDYTLASGGITLASTVKTITIPAGEDHVDITLNTVNNALAEVTETSIITLAASTAYNLDPVLVNRAATVSILDNEPLVTIEAIDATAAETDAADPADTGTFRISRTGDTTAALVVNFTRTGTATLSATGDYTLASGGITLASTVKTITIPAGEDHVDITLNTVNNALAEVTETSIITLAASTAYNLDPVLVNRAATVSILDNEPLVTIEAIDAIASETNLGDAADTGLIRISRTGSTLDPLTVKFTRSGTAKFGTTSDYTMTVNGIALTITSVVIPAGEDHIDIVLVPVNNTTKEVTETIILKLATSTLYNLDAVVVNRAATISVLDND